jgi:hypothetical protein
MAEIIKTDSIVKDFAKTNAVLLGKTADTALVFCLKYMLEECEGI